MPRAARTSPTIVGPSVPKDGASRLQNRARLAALRATGLVDGPTREALDRLTRLAARLLNVPTATVSLVDTDRQFFASAVGVAEPWATQRGTPLSHSFCRHVVERDAPFIIDDAPSHPLVCDNLAIEELGVVAYAGVPLRTSQGHVLGSFCAIDDHARAWTAEDLETLQDLAVAVVAEIELVTTANALSHVSNELRALLDDTTELVCAADADGRITFANQAWLDTLGFTLDDAVGMQAIELVVPDDRPRFIEAGRRLHAGEHVAEFEAVLVGAHGQRVVCRGRARAEMVDDPRAPGGRRCLRTHAAYRDVTTERRAEADRARLVALIESTGDFVATTRADGSLEYMNRAGRRLLGIADGAEARGLNAKDFHPAESIARLVTEAYPAALRDGRWAGDAMLLTSTKETIPVSMALVAHPSLVPGEAPYFTAIMRDLRERMTAEKALRESEARTRGAIEASLDAMYILRTVRGDDGSIADLVIADCNSQALVLARTTRDDIVGTSASVLFREARKRGLLDICARVVETGNPYTTEYRIPRADWPYQWAWLQIVRVGDGIAITARDITAQKASEDTLRALALVDDLTGVANRRGFIATAERECQRAMRERRSALLAYIDVNDFKQINDTHGHAEGDEALRSIGKVLRAAFRGADVIGRLGGDEFAVLVLPTNLQESVDANGVDLLARIETGIRERIEYQLSRANGAAAAVGRRYEISLSVGVASVGDLSAESMSPAASLEAIMADADERLYEAKRARRQP